MKITWPFDESIPTSISMADAYLRSVPPVKSGRPQPGEMGQCYWTPMIPCSHVRCSSVSGTDIPRAVGKLPEQMPYPNRGYTSTAQRGTPRAALIPAPCLQSPLLDRLKVFGSWL